jgi:phospholipid-translocating ATPase
MAICHTCLPETRDGTIDFQGSSTDEVALVRAARDLGYLLMHRTSQSITLIHRNTNGHEVEETYEILDVIEFSSKRKRMSIIVRCPDGRIWLICKGSDDMILPRLTQASLLLPEIQKERKSREIQRKSLQLDRRRSMGPSTEIYNRPSFSSRDDFPVDDNFSTPGRCMEHVDNFAAEGLRTLLFAHKIIPGPDYTRWKEQFQEANTSVVNRQERIEAISELIEESFDLLGATAIEDKLQQGVPETIEKLRRAHMRIWMLTGDKRETAIKIAHSAGICRPGSDIFNMVGFKADNLGSQISTVLEELSTAGDQSCDAVVVLDGHTLAVIENDADLKDPFYSLADSVSSVICCRASPAQKAAIVETIKSRIPGSLTLAIGDGANDISMIQTAVGSLFLTGTLFYRAHD